MFPFLQQMHIHSPLWLICTYRWMCSGPMKFHGKVSQLRGETERHSSREMRWTTQDPLSILVAILWCTNTFLWRAYMHFPFFGCTCLPVHCLCPGLVMYLWATVYMLSWNMAKLCSCVFRLSCVEGFHLNIWYFCGLEKSTSSSLFFITCNLYTLYFELLLNTL